MCRKVKFKFKDKSIWYISMVQFDSRVCFFYAIFGAYIRHKTLDSKSHTQKMWRSTSTGSKVYVSYGNQMIAQKTQKTQKTRKRHTKSEVIHIAGRAESHVMCVILLPIWRFQNVCIERAAKKRSDRTECALFFSRLFTKRKQHW